MIFSYSQKIDFDILCKLSPEVVMVCHRKKFLTPLHVLFLICLYISSRALSKVFEHKNFVARYRRETNHICESSAPLVTMDARLAYNIGRNIHIHNKLFYLLRQKMIYEHIAVLWLFFTWWVSLQVTPFKHIRFTSCFHRVFVDVRKRK